GNTLPANAPVSPAPQPPLNDWTPYQDQVSFETAEFLYRKEEMSADHIDTLLDLWKALFVKNKLFSEDTTPFTDHTNLHNTIDSTPIGGIPCKLFLLSYSGQMPQIDSPSWMSQSFDVWFCSPRALVHNILKNPEFKNEVDYAPLREFDHNGKQKWQNFMSGSWAWK
ncbi:hypothetical protein SERLA73DRAFT_46520, partial [Serpula lacrymans var. lacrymans S7.3]